MKSELDRVYKLLHDHCYADGDSSVESDDNLLLLNLVVQIQNHIIDWDLDTINTLVSKFETLLEEIEADQEEA